jgi:hypothetical protein
MDNIPTSFSLGGTTYSVKLSNVRPEGIRNDTTGHVCYPTNTIEIFTNHTGFTCTESYKELSFYHELVHVIFSTMGKEDLSGNEELIEGFANLLHQFIKTSKYE